MTWKKISYGLKYKELECQKESREGMCTKQMFEKTMAQFSPKIRERQQCRVPQGSANLKPGIKRDLYLDIS